MMMSDLPLDLLEEILSRVPATSMKKLRYTCKRWNALVQDQRFTEKHLSKAPKESMVLMLKEYTLCSISVNLNVAPPTIEFQGELGLKDPHSNLDQVEITDVFHCDGLLLCTTNDNRLVAWNPCLEETRWIQRQTGYDSSSRFALGYIQNNKSCRSYKILRRWGNYNDKGFEIYEFSSDSWRVLDDVVLDCFIIGNGYSSGASSLEGNTYWLAADRKEGHQFILSFDFTAERFKHMCLPPFQNRGFVTLSVGREEQLSALNQSYNNRSKREMWVTNKIDVDQSKLLWSKSFIVDAPIFCDCFKIDVDCFWIFTSLLIDAEKKVSLCCSVENRNCGNLVYTIGEDDEYHTEISYTNRKGWLRSQKWRPVIFNYVPSLGQIKKAEKKISDCFN